jgi:hypothetical protein
MRLSVASRCGCSASDGSAVWADPGRSIAQRRFLLTQAAISRLQEFDELGDATGGERGACIHGRFVVRHSGPRRRELFRTGSGGQNFGDQMIINRSQSGHDLFACQRGQRHLLVPLEAKRVAVLSGSFDCGSARSAPRSPAAVRLRWRTVRNWWRCRSRISLPCPAGCSCASCTQDQSDRTGGGARLPRGRSTETCPVRAFEAWQVVAKCQAGLLFCKISTSGTIG